MKKIYMLFFLGIVLISGYLLYPNHFPPRTPIKVARIISGLKIPREVKFEMLQDDWAFNGDGTTHLKAKLTDKQLSNLVRQVSNQKYLALPVQINSPELGLTVGIADGENGYYKLEVDINDPRDYTLTIIDSDKKEMIVYIWYM